MKTIKLKITGMSPLLMHGDRFANPLDPLTKAHKELTAKRKKTDADHEAIAKSEWLGGMYHDDDIGPYMPGVNVDAALVAGAKLQKLGTKFKSAVMVVEDRLPVIYEGPRDKDGMFADGRFTDCRSVKVQTAKLMRYRPKFNQWALSVTIAFNEDAVNTAEVLKAAEDAGRMCGIGDFRPRFGKFTVEVVA